MRNRPLKIQLSRSMLLALFVSFFHALEIPTLTPGVWRGTLASASSVTLVAVTLAPAADNALSVQVGGLSQTFLLTQNGNTAKFSDIPLNLTEADNRWTAAGIADDTLFRFTFWGNDDVAALTLVRGGDVHTYTLEKDGHGGLGVFARKHGPLAVLAAVFIGAQLLLYLARRTPVKEKMD
jgi:hypothetical protein